MNAAKESAARHLAAILSIRYGSAPVTVRMPTGATLQAGGELLVNAFKNGGLPVEERDRQFVRGVFDLAGVPCPFSI